MSRHARSRRIGIRLPRPGRAKHVRRRRVLPSLHALAGPVGYSSLGLALLALVGAVLMAFPRVDAGIGGRGQQASAQVESAASSRPDTTRRPKKARPTTTLQVTTTSVRPTTTTASTSISVGAAGLTSKPGPSPEITCPTGAVDIVPGQDIQAKINANASGTVFCLRAGRHIPSTAYLDPRPGDVFVGEYGAVVDGQNLRKQSFSYRYGPKPVTIKNLTIENFAGNGIEGGSGWTIDHNEVRQNGGDGVWFGSVNRSNYVHHNRHGGMVSGFGQSGMVVENNEIAFNNTDSIRDEPDSGGKMVAVQGADYNHNWVHDNYANGIYCDINCYGLNIHHNLVERNVKVGIELEISYDAEIHDNVLRGNGIVDSRCVDGFRCWFTDLGGVLVFDTSNVRVYGNIIEDANGHGIVGRQDDRRRCDTADVNTGRYCRGDHIVKNLQVYSNKIKAPTSSHMYSFSDGTRSPFVMVGITGPGELFGGTYNNQFYSNGYQVPATPGLSGNWFKWIGDTVITWSTWRSAGPETDGSISTY
jgi:parallel beta helix pectate lyase-like protein